MGLTLYAVRARLALVRLALVRLARLVRVLHHPFSWRLV
jgi:hypothetical protein